MTPSARLRPAVRGLVIDSSNDVLMVKLVFPEGVWWVMPGGGIEENEDAHAALQRELAEEVGLTQFEVHGVLWTRDHHFPMSSTDGVQWDGQSETVFVVRTPRFTPAPHMSQDQLHAENLHDHKWWSIDELHRFTGTDNFAPPDLAHRLQSFVDSTTWKPLHIVQHGAHIVSEHPH